MQHHLAGAWRGLCRALQSGQHLFRGTIEVDADTHARGQLHLHIFERLHRARPQILGAASSSPRACRGARPALPSSTVPAASRSPAQNRSGRSCRWRLRATPAHTASRRACSSARAAAASFRPPAISSAGSLWLPQRRSGGLRSSASATVITPGRLRSFSAYLSSGWPETKNPSTSFSLASRSPSSQSATRADRRRCAPCAGASSKRPKRPVCPCVRVLLRFLRALHRFVDGGEQLPARSHRIERAGLDERLDHALVHHAQIDLLAELPEAA